MKNGRVIFLMSSLSMYLLFLGLSCTKENVEEKYFAGSDDAVVHYNTKLKQILTQKCFSCHNYHSSSASKYDTYAKAAGNANEMVRRISSSNPNEVMPVPSANRLTEDEKQAFYQFLEMVEGKKQSATYKVSLLWTAFKFPGFSDRVGVSGTFDEIFILYKNTTADNIYDYLQDAEILINSSSVNIGNDALKNTNLQNHFFKYFTPTIYCKVIDVNPSQGKAMVKITMNGISEQIHFTMKENSEDLIFTGKIEDINSFQAVGALNALQAVCGVHHRNKVWADIILKAEIKNFKKFK
ncbi:MAG TPA: hypothetical protein VNI52_13020 [Sphingobacteriaceae bacterium]|nr:hypothetical protein [Sphingobacteriaceae bacterium]